MSQDFLQDNPRTLRLRDDLRELWENDESGNNDVPGIPEPGSPRDVYNRALEKATDEYKTGLDLAYEELRKNAEQKLHSDIKAARDTYYHHSSEPGHKQDLDETSYLTTLKNCSWESGTLGTPSPEEPSHYLRVGGHPMFNPLLFEMSKIHASKNKDYAADKPLSNLRSCEALGIPAYKGCFIRLTDKYQRAANLIASGEGPNVKDETIEDTLIDLSIYSLLTIILLREKMAADQTQQLNNQLNREIPNETNSHTFK